MVLRAAKLGLACSTHQLTPRELAVRVKRIFYSVSLETRRRQLRGTRHQETRTRCVIKEKPLIKLLTNTEHTFKKTTTSTCNIIALNKQLDVTQPELELAVGGCFVPRVRSISSVFEHVYFSFSASKRPLRSISRRRTQVCCLGGFFGRETRNGYLFDYIVCEHDR